jgi:hypothetical protein
MPKIIENALAATALLIGIALALATLGVDEQLPRQRIYSSSFLQYRSTTPALSTPLECDATVVGRSPGERPVERCYVLKSRRSQ